VDNLYEMRGGGRSWHRFAPPCRQWNPIRKPSPIGIRLDQTK